MMEDKRKKFKKRVYLKIGVIVVVLILVFIVSFIFAKKINKEGNDLIAKRIAAQTILVRNQSKASLSKEYEQAKPYIEKIQGFNFIASKDDVVKIISLLEKTAQETGNKQSVQLKEAQPAQDISALGTPAEKMNYTITLDGTYDSFFEYAKKITRLPYYINIDYINVYGSVDLGKSSQTVLGISFYIKK